MITAVGSPVDRLSDRWWQRYQHGLVALAADLRSVEERAATTPVRFAEVEQVAGSGLNTGMEFWIYLAIAAGMVAIGLTFGGTVVRLRSRQNSLPPRGGDPAGAARYRRQA